jgi:polyadenylate-binding protein 2
MKIQCKPILLVLSIFKIDFYHSYIGQVEYEATPEELRTHFASCGTINRITIMCDKISGQAKGYGVVCI